MGLEQDPQQRSPKERLVEAPSRWRYYGSSRPAHRRDIASQPHGRRRRGGLLRRLSARLYSLETLQYLTTILGLPVATLAILFAGISFVYDADVQAEDAAYRAWADHLRLRADTPEINTSGADYDPDRYREVAIHGFNTLEWIYLTRGEEQGRKGWRTRLERIVVGASNEEAWESTVAGSIREYETAIDSGLFICSDYDPAFVADTLQEEADEFCETR